MDQIRNPFSPGAGSPPPELAGRAAVLEQAQVLLGRVKAGRAEKSLLLTGLRGVGKTVLLNEMERMAQAQGYRSIMIEAHEGKSLAVMLAPQLRRLLFELDRLAGAGNKVRRALAVLKSFVATVRIKVGEIDIGIDIEPEAGVADSGDLELDLPSLFVALAEAARERGVAVAILIDEIQYFSVGELSALVMAMHKMQQSQLPLVLMAAGLPILPALVGESKSYAERLFNFPDIGPLNQAATIQALRDPIRQAGERIDQDALVEIARLTCGYPYFIQEWGYQAWNHAEASPISLAVVQSSSAIVSQRLERNFFRVRFDRLTPREQRFLRGMAELGAGPCRSGQVAEILAATLQGVGPVRASLIRKGMIYSPSHGNIAFTVPLFDVFLRRVIPSFRCEGPLGPPPPGD
jgi:hypothetical protein